MAGRERDVDAEGGGATAGKGDAAANATSAVTSAAGADAHESGAAQGSAADSTGDTGAGGAAPSRSARRRRNKSRKKPHASAASGTDESLPLSGQVPLAGDPDFPLRLTHGGAKRGRMLVADRDLPAGTELFFEVPSCYTLLHDYAASHCARCLRAAEGAARVECGDCGRVAWCSAACRALDAPRHAPACRAMAELTTADMAAALRVDAALASMVAAIAVERARLRGGGGASGGEGGTDAGPRNGAATVSFEAVDTLESHRDSVTPEFLDVAQRTAEAVLARLPQEVAAHCDADALIDASCRVNSNAYGVLWDVGGAVQSVAAALLPLCAMVNHSCYPNAINSARLLTPEEAAAVVARGGPPGAAFAVTMRTVAEVKRGEEVTVPYIALLGSRAARREELMATKHFHCECPRCTLSAALPPAAREAEAAANGVCCRACGDVDGTMAPAAGAAGGKKKRRRKKGKQQSGAPPPPAVPAPAAGDGSGTAAGGAGVGGAGSGGSGGAVLQCPKCGARAAASVAHGVESAAREALRVAVVPSDAGNDDECLTLLRGWVTAHCAVDSAAGKALCAAIGATSSAPPPPGVGSSCAVLDAFGGDDGFIDLSAGADSIDAALDAATRAASGEASLILHPHHALAIECALQVVHCEQRRAARGNVAAATAGARCLAWLLEVTEPLLETANLERAGWYVRRAEALDIAAGSGPASSSRVAGLRREASECRRTAKQIMSVILGVDHPSTQ